MLRPKGLDRESSADLFYLWAVVIVFTACALLALTIPASAKTVNVCISSDTCFKIKLPNKGKPCTKMKISVYEIRICR